MNSFRYLSLIDTPCGFDTKFFEMFRLALGKKEERQKHGVILLDEIHLRESINVNSKNLTYTGLIDFGSEGIPSFNLDEKADYGLVIMFQPLADFYSQPVAVFASKGPVSGEVLAQLIIKVHMMQCKFIYMCCIYIFIYICYIYVYIYILFIYVVFFSQSSTKIAKCNIFYIIYIFLCYRLLHY